MAQLAHSLDDEDDHKTVPLVEERAVVRKRKRLTGGVRVRTVVREDEQVIDETLGAEQVEVKRVPLDDRWVEAPVPVRLEGDTTIVTLHEEVVVVETRLRATEEVHLIRRHADRSARKRITLRREEAVIERLDAATDDEVDPA
ncbi:MAG: YsnF/AvaK domain-containing protein [Geminicoccaceae bacterium]